MRCPPESSDYVPAPTLKNTIGQVLPHRAECPLIKVGFKRVTVLVGVLRVLNNRDRDHDRFGVDFRPLQQRNGIGSGHVFQHIAR